MTKQLIIRNDRQVGRLLSLSLLALVDGDAGNTTRQRWSVRVGVSMRVGMRKSSWESGDGSHKVSVEFFLTGTPICRPYRPFRPFPSSSLTHPSIPMPASLHRPHGRWRSHPFLLLRQRWQRGLLDKSSSSTPSGC